MRTMPRKYVGSPAGDYRKDCDICGVKWHRRDLVRKPDGFLYCRDCQPETDAVTLSRQAEANSADSLTLRPLRERF